jgi:hypothetical protein
MSDQSKSWADTWTAQQQVLFKALFPPAAAPSGAVNESNVLESSFAELRETWQASMEKWSAFAKDVAKGGVPTPEALREMFAPGRWKGMGAVDPALQHVLEGPRYATLWDLDRKLLELQRVRLVRDKDVAAYQAVVQKAWSTAFERFQRGFGADAAQPGPTTWRGLADRWLATVNDTLIEVHRSDEFVEAQRRMLRSASDVRLQERKLAEAWCEAGHIPTRSEVDELQRTVTDMRRQLRALQREKAVKPEAAPARKSRAASTTRRSTRA